MRLWIIIANLSILIYAVMSLAAFFEVYGYTLGGTILGLAALANILAVLRAVNYEPPVQPLSTEV